MKKVLAFVSILLSPFVASATETALFDTASVGVDLKSELINEIDKCYADSFNREDTKICLADLLNVDSRGKLNISSMSKFENEFKMIESRAALVGGRDTDLKC